MYFKREPRTVHQRSAINHIVYLLLLYCVVVRSYYTPDYNYTQTELNAESQVFEKTTTGDNNPSGFLSRFRNALIRRTVNCTLDWIGEFVQDYFFESSFNEQESDDRSKDLKIYKETTTNAKNSFQISPTFRLMIRPSLEKAVTQWINNMIESTINYFRTKRQIPLHVLKSELDKLKKDREIHTTDFLRRKARSIHLNTKSMVSQETATNAKNDFYISPLSQLFRFLSESPARSSFLSRSPIFDALSSSRSSSHNQSPSRSSLQEWINQQLDGIAEIYMLETNKIYTPEKLRPKRQISVAPLYVLRNELNRLKKGHLSLSQFFSRIHKLKKLLKRRLNDVYSRNIVRK
ncbi:PREDICTED: uncharacterized protein LOC105454620 isoform X2 [Wasmannia auropunctata]|uniref:uncharacterized protein LOC105454620 isoform X2 n=1 Tax=Wasmannia auropunctata TaxID=64793 RepID=UPI0005F00BEB|nr:PREDICTED: uncharacterized protein LOC105454620 isoform X2 [Wasmannia auropunctata]